jgi:hypothetical protein
MILVKCPVGVLTVTENMGMDGSNIMLMQLQSYVQILKYMSLSEVKFHVSSTSSFPTKTQLQVTPSDELQPSRLQGFMPSGRP